ncbi:Uma2 family endonuclease [Nocardia mexicana]|uniref:Putative restriction endonuclease n=1 Tax=Nocardia mexicana TaxID=279262 RepID=A0A370H3M6_9NOCA|nr:Uma2 family endonuclease [Nocardia mexicana]RDI49792.1 putative restriction endonuclease [Nocardia mexicana]
MSLPHIERPDLPEYMTWEELERLPEEVAEQIELWNGRVVWVRRGPSEHQTFTRRMTNEIERCARKAMSEQPQRCWRVESETNVFFGRNGKSDFVTPDFMVYRCPELPYQEVRAADVLLVGEVLSPSNTQIDVEAKKGRYAGANIPWYWEVGLDRDSSAIATVRAYALEIEQGYLVEGVRPLRPVNYILAAEWSRDDVAGIEFEYPLPIRVSWSDLEF